MKEVFVVSGKKQGVLTYNEKYSAGSFLAELEDQGFANYNTKIIVKDSNSKKILIDGFDPKSYQEQLLGNVFKDVSRVVVEEHR